MKHRTSIKCSAGILLLAIAAWVMPGTAAAEEKGALNSADSMFVKKAAMQNKAEIKVAELGAKKAQSAEVKAFAEKMVEHHNTIQTEIEGLAKAKGIELSVSNDPEDEKTIQDLEKESGADFDKAFLNHMEEAHDECVDNYEEASEDTKDADLKAWVDKTLPMLRSHHESVKSLESKS